MPFSLPDSPTPGEVVELPLSPEDLSIRFIWQGNGVNNDEDFWKVVGTFSYGQVYDDIYVNKKGDVMASKLPDPPPTVDELNRVSTNDGFLVNLDKTGNLEPYPPLTDTKIGTNYVYASLVALLEENGINFGAFGIENNEILRELDGQQLVIRNNGENQAIIRGGSQVGEFLNVDILPRTEGGDTSEPLTYSYEWKSILYGNYVDYDATREYTEVTSAYPEERGKDYTVGDVLDTTSEDPATSSGCQVKVESVTEKGEILELSVETPGSGYEPGQVLETTNGSGTGCKVIVMDTVDLYNYEEEPDVDSPFWSLSSVLGTERKFKIPSGLAGHHIRCEVTVHRGVGPTNTVVSKSNSIGPINS